MSDNSVSSGGNSALGRVVNEGAAVNVGLLEVKVELLALVAGSRVEVGEDLGLQAAGKGIVELDLGSKEVGGIPGLSDADACTVCRQ